MYRKLIVKRHDMHEQQIQPREIGFASTYFVFAAVSCRQSRFGAAETVTGKK